MQSVLDRNTLLSPNISPANWPCHATTSKPFRAVVASVAPSSDWWECSFHLFSTNLAGQWFIFYPWKGRLALIYGRVPWSDKRGLRRPKRMSPRSETILNWRILVSRKRVWRRVILNLNNEYFWLVTKEKLNKQIFGLTALYL